MTVTWTQELADAIQAIVDEPTTADKAWRRQSDIDVHHRACEYLSIRVGHVFAPHQLEYTECLLQRLDLPWDNPRDSHTRFRELWAEAEAGKS